MKFVFSFRPPVLEEMAAGGEIMLNVYTDPPGCHDMMLQKPYFGACRRLGR